MKLGTKHSSETRERLSQSHLGQSPWNKQIHADVICGFCKKVYPFSHKNKTYCSHKCFSDDRKHKANFIPWNKGNHIYLGGGFKKGHTLGIGKVFSEETKEKMRQAKLGKKATPETRKKLSAAHKGVKSYLWRGGVTMENRQLRGQVEYRLWREAVFARDNWTCQFCGVRGTKLQADHIKPLALYPELRLALDNGRTLCKPCHLTTDTWGANSKPKCK